MFGDLVLVVGMLEGIEADPLFQAPVQFRFETVKQFFFIVFVEAVNNFIGEAYIAVNVVDILTYGRREHPGCQGKGSAVGFGNYFAALKGNSVEYRFHPVRTN